MVVASESAPRERESNSSSCRMFFFLAFLHISEKCGSLAAVGEYRGRPG